MQEVTLDVFETLYDKDVTEKSSFVGGEFITCLYKKGVLIGERIATVGETIYLAIR